MNDGFGNPKHRFRIKDTFSASAIGAADGVPGQSYATFPQDSR